MTMRPYRANEVYEFSCPTCGTEIVSEKGEGKCVKCGMLFEVGRKPQKKDVERKGD